PDRDGTQRTAQYAAPGAVPSAAVPEREQLVPVTLPGETVVRVRPPGRLARIAAGGLHPARQALQPPRAPLSDSPVRDAVAAQLQRDLVRPARAVSAGHRCHVEIGAVGAA